ncbi:Uncharacterized protein CTYZ_00003083 [Cryptosporidium tyzzeri]|nr:Uncharacterized protein CTYZ_00003083 [Cryptosporidium tyzzeri]
MNEDLSEYNHPESIISLLSPVSWLQMDEIKINSDFNLNNQNGYVKKKSERIIKELTYGKSKIYGILLKINMGILHNK